MIERHAISLESDGPGSLAGYTVRTNCSKTSRETLVFSPASDNIFFTRVQSSPALPVPMRERAIRSMPSACASATIFRAPR